MNLKLTKLTGASDHLLTETLLQGQGLARFFVAFAAGMRESLKVLVTGRCACCSADACTGACQCTMRAIGCRRCCFCSLRRYSRCSPDLLFAPPCRPSPTQDQAGRHCIPAAAPCRVPSGAGGCGGGAPSSGNPWPGGWLCPAGPPAGQGHSMPSRRSGQHGCIRRERAPQASPARPACPACPPLSAGGSHWAARAAGAAGVAHAQPIRGSSGPSSGLQRRRFSCQDCRQPVRGGLAVPPGSWPGLAAAVAISPPQLLLCCCI